LHFILQKKKKKKKKKNLVHFFCGIFACYRVRVKHGFLF
jgi:hypothetical protein